MKYLLMLLFILMCASCARHKVLRAGNKVITEDGIWVNRDNSLYVCYKDKSKLEGLKDVVVKFHIDKYVSEGLEHPLCLEVKWIDR